ncbi:MAG: hemerythrin family protein [Comamonadaceae bacterium]
MPNRVQWNPSYSLGNEILDRQHCDILMQCNALADTFADTGSQGEQKFQKIFSELMAQCGEHFSTEEMLLTRCACTGIEEHQNEHDEFNYLANEIITAENFENIELQRFLTHWWVGHIVGSGKRYRAILKGLPPEP